MLEGLSAIASISLAQGLAYSLVALGVYLSFRVLNFPDLTVEGTFVVGASIAATWIARGGDPVVGTILAIVGGMAGGAITGFLHTKLGLNDLLASIIVAVALYSVNLRIMNRANTPLLNLTTIYTQVEAAIPGINNIQFASTIAVLIIVVPVAAVALHLFLKTQIGLALRATGANEQMIRSLGVNTNSMVFLGLIIANGCTALGGALISQDQGFADVNMGVGVLVAGLAAVILGETLFGKPTVGRALISVALGSLVYRLIIALALRAGLSPNDLKMITSVLVVVTLLLPQFRSRIGLTGGRGAYRAEPEKTVLSKDN